MKKLSYHEPGKQTACHCCTIQAAYAMVAGRHAATDTATIDSYRWFQVAAVQYPNSLLAAPSQTAPMVVPRETTATAHVCTPMQCPLLDQANYIVLGLFLCTEALVMTNNVVFASILVWLRGVHHCPLCFSAVAEPAPAVKAGGVARWWRNKFSSKKTRKSTPSYTSLQVGTLSPLQQQSASTIR